MLISTSQLPNINGYPESLELASPVPIQQNAYFVTRTQNILEGAIVVKNLLSQLSSEQTKLYGNPHADI